MSLRRTKKRVSTKGSMKTKKVEIKAAYVLTAELGDGLRQALLELPMKYQPMLGSMIDGLAQAYRSDVVLNVPEGALSLPLPLKKDITSKETKDE